MRIEDDIDDYLQRCQEVDFVENEFIYEDLNLGDTAELAQQLGNVTSIGTLEEAENNSESNTTGSVSPAPCPSPAPATAAKVRHFQA